MPIVMEIIVLWQNQPRAQIDGPSVKPRQKLRLDLDVLHIWIVGRRLLRWNNLRQLQFHRAGAARVEMNPLNVAVEIARSVH